MSAFFETKNKNRMKFYSTKHQSPSVDLSEAVMNSMPRDRGLYMPEQINKMPESFWQNIEKMSFAEMSFEVAKCLLNGTIEEEALKEIVFDAINFDAPIHKLDEKMNCLELFHGPSLAFKDFGARFMARLMSHFVKTSKEKLYILVATSGDTGGAVAQGFLGTANIEVIILYPSQKISELQEKQLTTLGQNIRAIEVQGTFDDCQRMVKAAFLDEELQAKMNLSSANSINIARLIPQSFYYVYAYAQAKKAGRPIVFCVPSGNFGNITAGFLAQKIGMPVEKFVAANNANNVFQEYHKTGTFTARPSVPTYSNAMDVGNPSNLQRIQDLFGNDIDNIRKKVDAYSYDNEETVAAIKEIYEKYHYVSCPHTAVAYLGLKDYFKANTDSNAYGIFLGTAHPSKFLDIVEPALETQVRIPANLAILAKREKKATLMNTDFESLKKYLFSC